MGLNNSKPLPCVQSPIPENTTCTECAICDTCATTSNKFPSYIGCYSKKEGMMRPAVVTKFSTFNVEVKDKYMTILKCNDAVKRYGIASFGMQDIKENGTAKCVVDQDYSIKQIESANTCVMDLSDNNYYGTSDNIATYKTI